MSKIAKNRAKIWSLLPVAVCLLRALSPAPKRQTSQRGVFLFGNRENIDESRGWSRFARAKRFALRDLETVNLTAKAAIDNCPAGRAAKGATLVTV